ncbi:MAG TPA: hypothetical protein VIJ94_06765 [Caulobacteraceae bacterium]
MVAKVRAILLATLMFAVTTGFAARAAPPVPRCLGNPGVTGRCYWIRGEFALSADSLFIVERDDNGRWVVIRNAQVIHGAGPVDYAVPHNLEMSYSNAVNHAGSAAGAAVRGDFEVCPIPNQGRFADQAFACIQSATHLRRISPNWMSPAQKRLHDQSVADLKKDEALAAAAEKKRGDLAAARQMERRLKITPP